MWINCLFFGQDVQFKVSNLDLGANYVHFWLEYLYKHLITPFCKGPHKGNIMSCINQLRWYFIIQKLCCINSSGWCIISFFTPIPLSFTFLSVLIETRQYLLSFYSRYVASSVFIANDIRMHVMFYFACCWIN